MEMKAVEEDEVRVQNIVVKVICQMLPRCASTRKSCEEGNSLVVRLECQALAEESLRDFNRGGVGVALGV